ncbi:MAG: DNA-directed RNA polymerase subunit P [Candidatus Aenigmarchaeota archaeon]|nr:DNA-directed RNA polymerase subunit P [Candidatus Aenigmarchaeota archaeon]
MYKCIKCGKEFDELGKVTCPFCGFKIIIKTRPLFKKRVPAV